MPASSGSKSLNQFKTFTAGILFIGFSFWTAKPIFVNTSALMEITGELKSGKIDVVTVSSTSHSFVKHKSYSQKAILNFSLTTTSQGFSITENIGSNYYDKKYESILNEMKYADQVSVWIRKVDSLSEYPAVYKIVADGKSQFELNSFRDGNSGVAIFLFFLGLLFITIWFGITYPERFREYFTPEKRNKKAHNDLKVDKA